MYDFPYDIGPRTCRGRLRITVSADEKAKHCAEVAEEFRVISLPPLLGQPRAVNCLRLWPVSANEEREVTFGRGQPVGALRRILWFVLLNVDCERAIAGQFQILVLRADGETVDHSGNEEVVLIVNKER